jgi:Cdc6-like AAA superfamily ATPase
VGEHYKALKKYLTEEQMLVFICLIKACRLNSKNSVAPRVIYSIYISLCNEYRIVPTFKSGLKDTLIRFETAGLIRINKSSVTLLNFKNSFLSEFEADIYQDPVFSKYKKYMSSDSISN